MPRRTVLLLHSSGMSSRQWRPLATALAATHEVLTPDFVGSGARPPWPEDRPFHFTTDVDEIEALVRERCPVDLVGHSYGGLIALQVARRVPELVRTLSVYDPVAFGVLYGPLDDSLAEDAARGRRDLARAETSDVFYDDALGGREPWFEVFVDYWNGAGAWEALPEPAREAFLRVGRKVYGEVTSLTRDRTPVSAYDIAAPTLLLRGEHSPVAARAVARIFAHALPNADLVDAHGAGHMGPITHAAEVNALVAMNAMR